MIRRLLILTQHFLPMEGGSINWLVNVYGRHMPEESLFLAGSQPGEADVDSQLPFAVDRIPMGMADWDPTAPKSFIRYCAMAIQTIRRVRSFGVEQVHCAKLFPEGLAAFLVRRFHGTPYIVYAHGEEISTALESRKLAFLVAPIYRGASAVIANSHNTRRLLESIGLDQRHIHVIHPGVDLERFHPGSESKADIRRRFGIGGSPVLLTVGRLQKRKGHDAVIQALPAVREQFPDVTYLVVGNGEELSPLRELASAIGVSEAVNFVGKVSDSDLPAYYAACDLFVMANRAVNGDIEGFGMVFLEANAAGKPVVAGRSGGTADAVVDGRTGRLVDGEQPSAIAAALVQLLSSPDEMARMGRAGRKRVIREFSWERVVQKTRWVVESVSEKKRKFL